MVAPFRLLMGLLLAWTLLGAQTAAAQVEGEGRVSINPGWRFTPNDFLARHASAAGHALTPSPGGPTLMASFGYGAVKGLEIAIDLFGGAEQLHFAGLKVVNSVSYGGLVGLRTQPELFLGFSGSLGLATGVNLVNTSGGTPNTEHLSQAWVGEVGLHHAVGESLTMGMEYRLMLARGWVQGIGSVNGGGSWLGLSFSFRAASQAPPSHDFR